MTRDIGPLIFFPEHRAGQPEWLRTQLHAELLFSQSRLSVKCMFSVINTRIGQASDAYSAASKCSLHSGGSKTWSAMGPSVCV